MDLVEKARQGFIELGFHISEHRPYIAPINDAGEIKRLKAEIKHADGSSRPDRLHLAFLEDQLAQQEVGQSELLQATKTFEVFRSLPGDVRPIMFGAFHPAEDRYHLQFLARDLESDDHPLRGAGRVAFDFSPFEDENLASALRAYLSSQKQSRVLPAFPAGVIMRPGRCRIELKPPFFIYREDSDLMIAYANLVSAIRSLGYDMKEL